MNSKIIFSSVVKATIITIAFFLAYSILPAIRGMCTEGDPLEGSYRVYQCGFLQSWFHTLPVIFILGLVLLIPLFLVLVVVFLIVAKIVSKNKQVGNTKSDV